MIAYMTSVQARCGSAQARAMGPEAARGNDVVTILAIMSVITILTVAVPVRHARASNGPLVHFVSSISGVARLRRSASGRQLILGQRPW